MPFTPVELNGDDLLFLQYTGGTTGLSKGAALSHRNLVANTEQFKAFMKLRQGQEVIVTALPLYHIFALMVNFITYFSVGAENWLVANPRDMDGFVDVLKQARPSVFVGVNTLYAGLTRHPRIREVDFSRLKLAGGGGAAVVGATSAKWKAITGTFIREGYGLSETSPVLSFNPASIDEFSGTTGLPLPSTDIKLLDDDGREAPIGEAGEICVKGPQVMRGYWNQPEANAAAFTADGYFRTGDIGVFDERLPEDRRSQEGHDHRLGVQRLPERSRGRGDRLSRRRRMRLRRRAGREDRRSGQAVRGQGVRRDPRRRRHRRALSRAMAAYKVPRSVRFIDALPKSPIGKILRRELRDLA